MPKKQADGRYRAKLTIGYTAEGKAIYKYLSASTKYELERMKEEARKHYIDGVTVIKDKLFGDYIEQWFRVRKKGSLSVSWQKSHISVINNHLLPALGDRMMRAIQPMELQEFVNGFEGKCETTIKLVMGIITSVFHSALSDGIIQRDPTSQLVRPKAADPKKRRALTEEERSAIKKVIDEHPYGLLLGVLYYLGLRKGEALGLQWGDFDFELGIVRISRDIDFKVSRKTMKDPSELIGKLKTKRSEREIPIPDDLLRLLLPKRGFPSILLFSGKNGKPLSENTFREIWLSIMVAAGLAEKRDAGMSYTGAGLQKDYTCEITPHYLRHNFVTVMYEAGIDPMVAMSLAGHANYATTANIYTHLDKKYIEEAKKKLNALSKK